MDGCKNFKKSVLFLSDLYYTIISMKNFSKKLFSIFLSAFFVAGSFNLSFANVDTNQETFTNLINEKVLNYSSVTDSYNANNEGVIVWIQDLHNDFVTQKKIYNILNILTRISDFEVYGEGIVDETLDVSFFNSISNKQIKEKTINDLFQTSVLSGCEYFALLNGNKKVKGIEDKKVYEENLKLLEYINKNKEFNNFLIETLISYVKNLKQHSVINKDLSLKLSNLNEINAITNYPNLYKYQTVYENLSGLNRRKLNAQFKNFVNKYRNNPKIYDLLKQNSDYGYAKIYDYIIKETELTETEKKNKELFSFFENTKLITEINSIKLLYEKEAAINELLSLQISEKSEKEILNLEHFSYLLKDLVNTNILPQHYTELKENQKYVSILFQKYLPKNISCFALSILNNKTFFEFYDTNLYRNKIFIENLVKDNSNKIIVAGGFHCDITKELKKQNKSYMVLTPSTNINSAFNKLFATTIKYGSNEEIVNNIMSVISSWKIFFADTVSFQNEINNWLSQNPLSKNTQISVKQNIDGYTVTINYNGTVLTKTFLQNEEQNNTIQHLTKSNKNAVVDQILKIASRPNLFGQNVTVKITSAKTLLDETNFLPMSVSVDNDTAIISVNENFLTQLYNNEQSLTETAVKLLYFSYSKTVNTDTFIGFINSNYENLQKIYSIKTRLASTQTSLFARIKAKIKNLAVKVKNAITNFKKANLIPQEVDQKDITTIHEQNMAQALKQATIARQNRSYLKTFTQPPIGAFIRLEIPNDNGTSSVTIEGKNFNSIDSVLHAETLTFIDFLKNYIQEFEMLPSGNLTEKGTFLTQLLDLAIINGHHISNKTFQKRPMLLSNLGITIDYSQKRDINTVFTETNAILKFVNDQLGNPLSNVTLYCTLAPCNKCVRTMSALGIDTLVYGSPSVNQNHKSINTLINNGIKVEGNVLQKQCDERIQNYRFMNASPLRTKIASIIQNVRRFTSSFFKKSEKSLKRLLNAVTTSEQNIITITQTITDLQNELDWANLQSNETALNELIDLLKQTDAYEDSSKRAGLIYAIKNKCLIKINDGKIYFYNKQGQQLDFYIGIDGKFAASQNYLNKMNILAQVKNFADLDDNLALRDMSFNKDIQSIFSTLTLYGIAQILPVTGNTLEKVKIRLDPLTSAIKNLIPAIYIENAALSCTVENGEFVIDENYTENIAKSALNAENIKYLETLFGGLQSEWYNLFVSFVTETKNLRASPDASYGDFIDVLLKKQPIPDFIKEKISKRKILSRQQAEKELNEIYLQVIQENFSKEIFLSAMKVLSLVELSRLYFSQDPQDTKEAVRLRQDIESIDNGQNLSQKLTSNVRYIITAFRPNLVRENVAQYFKRIVQQKYPELDVISTGQTTICVYKKAVNKSVPLRNEINNGTPAQNIIFTGDEFNVGGVDYPIYMLQREQGNDGLVVINTNSSVFEGDFVSLTEIDDFPSDISVGGNIKRNVLLQQLILSIVEENIGLISTNPDYEPVNIAQELKERIFNINQSLSFDVIRKTKNAIVGDMLKAA